jgi:hypothetical protein
MANRYDLKDVNKHAQRLLQNPVALSKVFEQE